MMKGQIAGLMKQAQQMQENVKKIQEKIAATEVTGESGAGLVKVVLTGDHRARRVTIDPSLLAEDRDMLEDLIVAAINDASTKVADVSNQMMAGATGGMAMPPGFKLPF